ncbi:PorP/SprF family type IX secretion system membrane protein [Wenyingzhuangia sp. IMCC45533]
MKNILQLIALVLLLNTVSVFSQQDPNFNMYRFNMNIINPAYAGASDVAEVQIMHKSQWLGLEGAPETQTAFFSTPLKNNLGLGVTVNNDQIFILGQTNVAVDVSYKLKISNSTSLFFGVKPGANFTNIDLTKAGQDGVSDPFFERNESYVAPIFGAGFYLKHDNWYVNLSTPNFLRSDKFVREGGAPSAVTTKAHYYFGAGYSIKLTPDVVVTPEFIIRTVQGAPTSYNVAMNYQIIEKIHAGINWRIEENVGFYTMFDATEKLSFGIGYDFTTSQFIQSNENYSLEFLAKYKFL